MKRMMIWIGSGLKDQYVFEPYRIQEGIVSKFLIRKNISRVQAHTSMCSNHVVKGVKMTRIENLENDRC